MSRTRKAIAPSTAPAIAKARNPWREKLQRPKLICALLLAAVAVVFWRVGSFGFVNYDDPDYVTANPRVQSGLKWQNIVWAFTSGHASNWHPLTWLSHMLDWQFFGPKAGPQHLVSVGFHALNSLVLFLLLKRMTGAHWRSAVVAALFALHPLRVESVAWISERKDVLSAFFLLLTLWAYWRYATARAQTVSKPNHTMLWYGLALGCFALGLLSKPMLVTLPFLLLLLDYWPLTRIRFDQSELKTALRLAIEKVPFFVLAAASSVVTFLVQRHGGAVSTVLPFSERVSNALVSYARYVGKTIWPERLSVLYPHPGHWPFWEVTGSVVLFLALLIVVILAARKRPYLPVGWFWFIGSLVPVIGLIQVGVQSMADRYTYLPSIGLFIAVVWGAGEVIERWTGAKPAIGLSALLALAACVCVSAHQVRFWQNSETLFRRAVEVTSNNYLAYNNLGFYFSEKGKLQEAKENYLKSLAINPRYSDALNNLGFALAGEKKYAEAIPYYVAALSVSPDQPEIHNNFGNALSELGRINEAIEQYAIVLRQKPDHADAHNNLGIALAMQGKLEEALGHFRAAIRAKPGYASAHSNLGNALVVQHKIPEAILEYEESLRLNPKEAQAHNNLGNALLEQGKLDESIEQYTEALRLNSDNPEGHFNIGVALSRANKKAEAAVHFREALRLNPGNAEARRQLELLSTGQ